MMMTSPIAAALFSTVYYGFLGALFLIIPRLWRPEVPFGVSVPHEGTKAVRACALRYWNMRVVALAVTIIGCALVLAILIPSILLVELLAVPFFGVGTFFYVRARKMLLPFSRPSKKVGASLRQRRYRDYMSLWWEIIPLCLLAVGVVATVWTYLAFPEAGGRYHNIGGNADLWIPKRLTALGGALFPGVFVYPLFLLLSVLIAHSKQSVGAGDPDVCLAASDAFRKVWIRYFYVLRVVLAANFAILACCIGLANSGVIKSARFLPFIIGGGVVSLVLAGVVISFRYGQGGWRWAVRQGLVQKREAAAILDGDGMRDERWKLGMFYFNPRDPSVLVEKRFGIGWTINFGSIWGLSLIVAILATYLFPVFLRFVLKRFGS